MKVFCIYNSKGGVAKTTTSVHLSFGLKFIEPKSRILLIDLDGQYSLKTYFRMKLERGDSFDFIFGDSLQSCIYPTSVNIENVNYSIDIMPSSSKMNAFDAKAANQPGRENLLKVRMEECELEKLYDYIILDCPPSLNLNSINGIMASDYLISPANMDDYCIPSVNYTKESLSVIKRNMRTDKPELLGILPTMYDPRQSISRAVFEALPSQAKGLHIFQPIRLNSSFRKAQVQRSVVYGTEKSPFKATEDYFSFCKSVLTRISANKATNHIEKSADV